MDFSKVRVLLTDGSGRQTMTIMRGLKEIGCKVSVLCGTKKSICAVSKFPDEKIVDPRAECGHKDYVPFLLSLVSSGEYDVIFPIGEIATNKITENEEEFKKYVKLACAPRSAYQNAFNKQKTYETALRLGIPCAHTRMDGQSVNDYLKTAHFPVIVKPRQGMGSIGFHKFNTEKDFREALEKKVFEPDEYIIQEFVEFEKRRGTYIMMDQHSEMKSSLASEVIRWYPIDAGTSVVSMSIDDPEIIEYAGKLLKELGWQGYANVGFMMDKRTNTPKLLEINGRIPAPVKLTAICGINVAKQLIEMAYDEEVSYYPPNTKFGMMARHTQADLMWFIKSPNRFKAKPSWFSWKNTTDLVFWKDDPRPFFMYTLSGISQYKEFMAKRKR